MQIAVFAPEAVEVAELKEMMRRPSARPTHGAMAAPAAGSPVPFVSPPVSAEQAAVDSARQAGIGPLLVLGETGTDGQRERVCAVIAELASTEEMRVTLAKAGGIDAMIRLANSGRFTEPMRISRRLSNAKDDSSAEAEAKATVLAKVEAAKVRSAQ